MSGRKRIKKYSRRAFRSRRSSSKGWLVALAIVAFLLLCFIISVVIGLALGKRADEYKESPKYDLDVKDYYSGDKRVRAVDAHEYQWGYSPSYYVSNGITDLSVCLRDRDGFITYNSEVEVSFGGESSEGSRSLDETVEYVHSGGGYLCGYIYIRSFEIEDDHLREIYKAYEAALVAEASEGGVDEIMLVGIAPDEENIDETERFVSDMALAAGDKPLGVMLSLEVFAATENDDYRASRIRSVCDFVALDMTDMPENADEDGEEGLLYKTIGEMEYYIKSYSARIVLSAKNSSLYGAAVEYGVKNIQIIE